MKRLWVVGLSILFGSLCAFYYRTQVRAAERDDLDNYTSWTPNSAAVRQHFSGDPQPREAQLDTFGELLTQRFRNHDPKIAVRVKFKHNLKKDQDMLVLMCPARMEPWNMDWLAVNTWREAKDDLGISYPIDIYITYIGLSQVKVAELRPMPGTKDKVMIQYRTPEQIRRAMNGKQPAEDSAFSGGVEPTTAHRRHAPRREKRAVGL